MKNLLVAICLGILGAGALQAMPGGDCGNVQGPCAGGVKGGACYLGQAKGVCEVVGSDFSEHECVCGLRLEKQEGGQTDMHNHLVAGEDGRLSTGWPVL